MPRELLWQLLDKFGVPPKLIYLLRVLHQDVSVKFDVDGIEQQVRCTIGVKQGDILGPVLFSIYIAGIMISWRETTECPALIFLTKYDCTLTGRHPTAKGDQFVLSDSEYADDTAMLFDSRESVEKYSPLLFQHFSDYGMEIHAGDERHSDKKSKTEVLFVAAPPSAYADPSSFDNANLGVIPIGSGRFFPVVDQFCYLGSILTRDCTDDADVKARITKAAGAFGSVRKEVFSNTRVCFEGKRLIYEGLILAILLYGCESWCLTEKCFDKLRLFHARCTRAMCRVTRWHTWKNRISTEQLWKRIGLKSIDTYINRRQLQWAGHVMRMPYNRLPRKMMTCWLPSTRPKGCPKFTYGRSLYKALKKVNISKSVWVDLAMERERWQEAILR